MFTVFLGSILPDADTIASRSRFWIVSTVTVVPVSPRRANAAAAPPPATRSTSTIQNHFLRNTRLLLFDSATAEAIALQTLSGAVAHHREHRGHERCHTHIDGQQPPHVSPRPSIGRGRESDAQQPHPPQPEHVDGAEQARRPRAFVE